MRLPFPCKSQRLAVDCPSLTRRSPQRTVRCACGVWRHGDIRRIIMRVERDRPAWVILVVATLLVVSSLTDRVIAGQQDAGIIGAVTDESGGMLPGVTVTATSPALQLPAVTAVTDE